MGRTEAERVLLDPPDDNAAFAFIAGQCESDHPALVAIRAMWTEAVRLRAERDLLAAEVRLRRAYSPIYSSNADYGALMAAEAAVDAAGCLTGEGG